ncbi:MAG: hypothetical protein WD423_15290 [Rhodothermales bacterium]
MSKQISLVEKVAFLRDPETYGSNVSEVDDIETHMNWVFLAGTSVYKLKKPVKLDFLDFSTLELRRDDCRREVEVNRALAGGVYHGTVPLVADASDALQLGGDGAVVDWLVHMRRLPNDRMLDVCIQDGSVGAGDIRRAIAVLCRFYRSQGPTRISPDAYVDRFTRAADRNEKTLLDPRYRLSEESVLGVFEALRTYISRQSDDLRRRVEARRIVDAHGDLRPEHICLEPRPVIFDRIEFNDEFRILDTADEISYLSMECDLLDAEEIGRLVMDAYTAEMDDHPPPSLTAFYRTHRACVRAVLAAKHLDDEDVDEAKWIGRARSYLDLASSYLPDMMP